MDSILKELKKVPVERLDDLYAIIHSFQKKTVYAEKNRERILSFSGSFADLSESDFEDFRRQTKESRNDLFNRERVV